MLPLADHLNIARVNELIERCELGFRDERQAWYDISLVSTLVLICHPMTMFYTFAVYRVSMNLDQKKKSDADNNDANSDNEEAGEENGTPV
jgi:hypothetical protein